MTDVKMLRLIVPTMLGVAVALPCFADPINARPVSFGTSWDPYPSSLQDFFDGLIPGTYSTDNGIDAYLDQYPVAIYSPADALIPAAAIMLELAGYKDENTFGIYEYGNHANRLLLFTGPNSSASGTVTVEFDAGTGTVTSYASGHVEVDSKTFSTFQFGFWLSTPEKNTFYSEDSLNNGYAQAVIYEGPAAWNMEGEFIIAFEDLALPGGDSDYNDLVVRASNIQPAPVPEGSTLLLFGSGLCGLLFVMRKKRLVKL
jgi:hypothetical protein